MKYTITQGKFIVASFAFELHRDMTFNAMTERFPYANLSKGCM